MGWAGLSVRFYRDLHVRTGKFVKGVEAQAGILHQHWAANLWFIVSRGNGIGRRVVWLGRVEQWFTRSAARLHLSVEISSIVP